MSKRIMVTLTDTDYNELMRNAQQQSRPLSNLAGHYLRQGLYQSATVSNDVQQPVVTLSNDVQHIAPALYYPPSDPLERNSLSSDLLEKLSTFLDKTPQLLEDMDLVKECVWNMDCGLSAEWYRSDAAMVEYLKARGCSIDVHQKHRLPPGPKGWKPPEW